ncbi:hypothetical protein RRF57_004580 [Xylaria bambusicola]|uniref:NmrA-like domain-containing protein n=1 Tax=Xylaria bambusicola TaxID=326684 RepID=A0AAN7YX55_9PEZI
MMSGNAGQKVLVIGATGNQGTGVVRHCAAAGIDVYALSRDLTSAAAQKLLSSLQDDRRVSDQLHDKASCNGSNHHLNPGTVHLVQGDLNNVESLMHASQGMNGIFFFTMPGDAQIEQQQTRNVLEAARASGSVSMVIYTSAAGTDWCDSFPERGASNPLEQFWLGKQGNETLVRQLSDDSCSARKIDWVIVRPANFLQNFIPPISTFVFPQLYTDDRPLLRVAYHPETRLELIDAEDVGLVVVAAMTQPSDWAGKAVSLVVDRLTIQEVADVISGVRTEASAQGPTAGNAGRVKVNVEYVGFDVLKAEIGEPIAYPQHLINEIKHFISPREEEEDVIKKLPLTSVKSFFTKNSPRK